MTTASKESYASIVDSLPNKRATVYKDIFEQGSGATIRETRLRLGWEHTTVSARIFELAEAGLIKESGTERGGQTVWTHAQPSEMEALRAARKAKKRYETGIAGFRGLEGPDGMGPSPTIRVEIDIPREIWKTLKSPVRVRFL